MKSFCNAETKVRNAACIFLPDGCLTDYHRQSWKCSPSSTRCFQNCCCRFLFLICPAGNSSHRPPRLNCPLFVTSGLLLKGLVTQDSLNNIMGLMSFNWKEILTCRPNCIWLKTILVLLLANWSGRVGARQVWQDQWCPCGNILNIFQLVMNRWDKSIAGLARWRNMQHEGTVG